MVQLQRRRMSITMGNDLTVQDGKLAINRGWLACDGLVRTVQLGCLAGLKFQVAFTIPAQTRLAAKRAGRCGI